MKKNFTIIGGVILVVLFLTGCCLKHDWDEATCKQPKTCAKCGATEGDKLDHEWENATCTEPKTCENCGKTKGEAAGHEWIEATCTEPKTCSTCGETEGEAIGHAWITGSCLDETYCYFCDEKNGEVGDHIWLEANCREPKTCWVCNLTEGERTSHEWTGNLGNMYCCNCAEHMPEDSLDKGNVFWEGITIIVPRNFKLGAKASPSNGVFEGENLMFTVLAHWNTGYSKNEILKYYGESLREAQYDIQDEGYYYNSEGREFYRYKILYDEIVYGYCTIYIQDDVYVYMECFAVNWDDADNLYENVIDTFDIYY